MSLTQNEQNFIILDERDNVCVLTQNLGAILAGHKIARRAISKGESITKYGYTIGLAKNDIKESEHVHTHNVDYHNDIQQKSHEIHHSEKSSVRKIQPPKEFTGYKRTDGSVGIRNYVVVMSTVNCSASVVKAICRQFLNEQELAKYGLDGIVPVTHQAGCAQAIGGDNYNLLNKTLYGWVNHPNVVGALVIGLGCEGTTFKSILQSGASLRSDLIIETINIQNEGGTQKTIEKGTAQLKNLLSQIKPAVRQTFPISEMNLALNCGGSDAFSSITANPVLGLVSDMITEKGGTVVLAEIPECHGAEGLLQSRTKDAEVLKKLDDTFQWWNDYAEAHKVSLNNNLAPGNIAGGITTIIEKSLGAVAKAGHGPLVDVVGYSEKYTKRGFNLMNTPGFDPASVTGLVAGGSTMVAFTTGRGSVYGCAIAPTLKIATNHELFKRMSGDMDFDASQVLRGKTFEEVAVQLLQQMVDVANGQKTCSEALGLGWEEFVPWNLGETL